MSDSSFLLHQMISLINIEEWVPYIICVLLFTIIIRVLLCFLKAWAIVNGESDNNEKGIKWKGTSYRGMFWSSFLSNKRDVTIDDYWLPAIVGCFELLVYPILMSQGKWSFIGAWIAVKTASAWGGWQHYRTAYNRFLLGNILSLGFSMLLAWLFVR